MDALRARRSEVIIPEPIRDELENRDSPLRRFIRKNKDCIAKLAAEEDKRTLVILAEHEDIDAPEAAAMSLALERNLPLIIEEGAGRRVATKLGVRCYRWRDFVDGKV